MKREKKTIAQMMAEKKPKDIAVDEINKAVDTIHALEEKKSQPDPPVAKSAPLKTEQKAPAVETKDKEEKKPTKRASVDLSVDLHKTLRRIVLDLDTDLKTFFIEAAIEKAKSLGYDVAQVE